MNLERCFICQHPVLELDGQFEKFDSYYLDASDDAYQQDAYGWCHSFCLSNSRWGKFWSERLIQHKTELLGFEKICSTNSLTVLRNPRVNEITILRNDGITFWLKPPVLYCEEDYQGGFVLPVLHEMNLELDDSSLVNKIQQRLITSGSFPLQELVQALDLTQYLLYPEAIVDGTLQFDKKLKREWDGYWVSVLAKYKKFVPQEVVDILESLEIS
jgi:hypothetical protein